MSWVATGMSRCWIVWQNIPLSCIIDAGGNARMQLLKPPDVQISVTAHSDVSVSEGPFDEDGDITLPSNLASVDITLDIPP